MNNNKLLLLRRANFIGGTFRHFSAVLANNNNHAWCCSTCTLMNANCCGHEKNRRHHQLQLLTTIQAHSQQQHFCKISTTPNSNTSSSDQTTNNGIKVPDPIEQQCEHWAQIVRAEWETENAKHNWLGRKLKCTNVFSSIKSSRITLSTEDLAPEQVRSLRQFFQVGDAVELKLKKDFPHPQQQHQNDSIGPMENNCLFGIVNKKFPNAIEFSVKQHYFNQQQRQWLQQSSFDIRRAENPNLLENQLVFLKKRHSDWYKLPGYATLLQAFKCQPLPEDTGLHPVDWVGSSYGKDLLDPSQCTALSAALNLKRPLVAVHGPPGSGKTLLLAEYLHALSQQGKRALVLSPNLPSLYNLLTAFCKKFPSAASRNGTFLCLKRFDSQLASKVVADVAVERLIEARTFVKLPIHEQDEETRKLYKNTRTLKAAMEEKQDYSGEEDLKREAEDVFKQMRDSGHQMTNEATRNIFQQKSILFMNNISIALLNLFTRNALTFDVVIFDDAAKLSEFESWMMALPTAPVMRLFGDYNQPGIPVRSSIGKELGFNKSLLQRLDEQFGEEMNFHLQRQYRSNAAIQAWPNRAFYGQRAAEPDESVRGIRLDDLFEEGKSAPQGIITDPLVLVDLGQLEGEWHDGMFKAEKGGRSWFNWGEAFLTAFHLYNLFEHIPQLCPSTICYLTLFDAQRIRIWDIFSALSGRHLNKLKQIRMEHNKNLQGQQFDVLLRDSVTVPPPELFINPYLLKHLGNEMCRARRQFIWLANSRWLEQGSEQSRQLLETFRQHGRIVGPNELMPLEPGQFQKMTKEVEDNYRKMQQQEQRVRAANTTNVRRF